MNQVRRLRDEQSNSSGGCCVVRTRQFSNQGEHSLKKEQMNEKDAGARHACCAFPTHVLPGFKRCCGFSKQTQLGGRKSVTSRAQRERPRLFADLADQWDDPDFKKWLSVE